MILSGLGHKYMERCVNVERLRYKHMKIDKESMKAGSETFGLGTRSSNRANQIALL